VILMSREKEPELPPILLCPEENRRQSRRKARRLGSLTHADFKAGRKEERGRVGANGFLEEARVRVDIGDWEAGLRGDRKSVGGREEGLESLNLTIKGQWNMGTKKGKERIESGQGNRSVTGTGGKTDLAR